MAAPMEWDDLEGAALRFRWGTPESEEMNSFKQGIKHLRQNAPHSALNCFRRAVELQQNNPYFLSFYGLALARAEYKWDDAERICRNALQLKPRQPQLYANLAEVYLKACKREDAVDALLEGAHYDPGDIRLNRMLAKLGIRRPPVLSFLERDHALNRLLGRIRHRAYRFFSRH